MKFVLDKSYVHGIYKTKSIVQVRYHSTARFFLLNINSKCIYYRLADINVHYKKSLVDLLVVN